MATSQPQPIQQQQQRQTHAEYANSSFNPASYTRHFLGSPISWRAASFGSHLNQEKHLADDNGAGTFFNALSSLDREGELCRNYTCCGLHLHDLHALIEHFEEVHIVVLDPSAPPHLQIPFNPQPLPLPPQTQQQPAYFPYPNLDGSVNHKQQLNQHNQQQQHNGHHHHHQNIHNAGNGHHHDPAAFDPDDMDIEMDTHSTTTSTKRTPSSGAPSPPDTPITTPLASHPFPISVHTTHAYNPHANTFHSQPPSPSRAFDPTALLRPLSAFGNGALPVAAHTRANAFNAYAGAPYNHSSSSSIAGAIGGDSGANISSSATHQDANNCVPPALLFSSPHQSHDQQQQHHHHPSSAASSSSSQDRSPSGSPKSVSTPSSPIPTSAAPRAPILSRPSTSMLLSKPFRCPKPNCNKSYKQANGLKYHITHGSCNFTPAKEVEQVQAIIAQRQSHPSSPTIPSADPGVLGTGLSENELREVEKEAERQLRPYACGIADCQRRYKNMNGLRYHYQHSGEHGAIGLALLASGTHQCLAANRANSQKNASSSSVSSGGASSLLRGERRTAGSRASSRAGSRAATPPGFQYPNVPPLPPHQQLQQHGGGNYGGTVTALPVQMGYVNGMSIDDMH